MKGLKKSALLVASVLLVSAFGACSEQKVPEDHYYRLQVTHPQQPAGTLPGTVQVDRFSADGLTAGRPIVFTQSGNGHQLQEYHYHFWTEPPAILLRDQLIGYLRASGVGTHVVTPEMRVDVDYVVTGKIKRLEQVLGATPMAEVAMEIGVRRVADGGLVYLESFHVQAPSSSEHPGDGVAAMNAALDDIFSRFVAGLSNAR